VVAPLAAPRDVLGYVHFAGADVRAAAERPTPLVASPAPRRRGATGRYPGRRPVRRSRAGSASVAHADCGRARTRAAGGYSTEHPGCAPHGLPLFGRWPLDGRSRFPPPAPAMLSRQKAPMAPSLSGRAIANVRDRASCSPGRKRRSEKRYLPAGVDVRAVARTVQVLEAAGAEAATGSRRDARNPTQVCGSGRAVSAAVP
jgi:hypothetical protein